MASNHDAVISEIVAGDDHSIFASIPDVPENQTIASAIFTVKSVYSPDDDDAIIQKSLSLIDIPGTGFVTDDGASGTGQVRIDLIPADTILLIVPDAGPVRNRRGFLFDIQATTSAGKKYTPISGVIRARNQVTTS